ncbi:hypothetical protein RS3R1_50840 [Pseudomonas atacamensis]|uniref:DUF4113 domain-containing protein n=1 Tax=Pseudomonas atacamensis TaxID=2565368 RepID=A0ABQ5PRP0_9PSED|nr:hypothetical protein RS3R1_50840 [Pseudomonas atacamensis]
MTPRIREQARSHKWNSVWTEISATAKAPCGSEPAREGVLSGTDAPE